MKITAVNAVPVRVPRPRPFTSSLGVSPASENAVIEIHTDEGLVGLGEASSIWDRKGQGDVVREPLRIEDGYLYPPSGPGLGVSLDHEQLARYRIDR
jgi:L-alanine-DL-glutamate epimerase-like enolase superfamily enzyme